MASAKDVRRILLNKQWNDSRYERTRKEAVLWYYGQRLLVEVPDGESLVFRLSIYGRTIACSDDEREVWQEAFDDLVDLLEPYAPHRECAFPQAYGGPVIYA